MSRTHCIRAAIGRRPRAAASFLERAFSSIRDRMALELGAARYLRKPLTPDALLAAIKD
ncbi:hypothetical protein [Bradyrhizobium sp. CCGB01]|uniref:hypothetical protein n=1 Tax=Bradyrhizobium sp. CCGB01 TaxID=2949634 RepID=UPI0035C74CDE